MSEPQWPSALGQVRRRTGKPRSEDFSDLQVKYDEAGQRCTHAGAWPFRAYMWGKKKKLRWVWCESSCRTRSTALQQCSGPFVDDPEAGSKGIAVVSPGFYRSERTREAPQGRNYFSLHSSAVHLIYQVWYGNESSCRFCSHRFWNRLRHHEGAGYRFLTAIFLSLKKQRFKNGEHRWDVRD